jgi:thiol:disulfide interchange protein DsbD
MHLLRTLLACCIAVAAWAQGFDPVKDVSLAFRKGAVELRVPEQAHLKAAFMKVEKKEGTGTLTVGPLPKTDAVDELGDPVWHGTVRIPVRGLGLKSRSVVFSITYQPCTEGEGGVCFPPTTRELKVLAHEIPVLREEKANAAAPTAVPTQPQLNAALPAIPAHSSTPNPDSKGALIALLAAFLGGLAASLTPCVYPMIPITMAIVGAKGGGKAKGFMLSLSLVLGMAVTYTALGVLAAKSGSAAGSIAQKPAFLIPVSVLFGIFALSLFGAFEISLPASLQAKLQGEGGRKGYGGAFIMGLVLGPLSAPCVGPVIGTVLLSIAAKGQVAFGALQLFIFALGMGVLFMIVGTFGASLPRSGDWLTRFKQFMGVVVLGFAVWNVRLLLPHAASLALWALVTLIAAAVLGAFESAEGLAARIGKGLGLISLAVGVLLGIRAVETQFEIPLLPQASVTSKAAPEKAVQPSWIQNDYEGALAKAKQEGKVVVIDIFAEWCAQCHELDEKTWPDSAVRQWMQTHAIALRLDTDAKRPDLAKSLKVLGYPTILVLGSDGAELRRASGFQKPEAMLAFLEGR